MAEKKKTKKKTTSSSYETKIIKKVGLYQEANTSSIKLGDYLKDTKVVVIKTSTDSNGNSWGYTEDGWFMLTNKKSKEDYTKGKKKVKTPASQTTTKKGSWKTVSKQVSQLSKYTKSDLNTNGAINKTMQLFGIPYQFLNSVDTRVEDVNKKLGRKYLKNFVLDAPVITIMPGQPKYLPGEKNKAGYTQSFLEATVGSLGALKQISADADLSGKDLQLYDFQSAYIEYMQYVNILCRACASFLELDLNKEEKYYKVNDDYPNLLTMDWKDYRWDGSNYHSAVGSAAGMALTSAKDTAKTVFGDLKDAGSSIMDYLMGYDKENKTADASKYNAAIPGGGLKHATSDSTIKNYQPVYDPKSKKGTAGIDKGYSEDSNLDVNDNTTDMSDDELSIMETLGRKVHYVQFYCDPTNTNYSESISNSTQQSSFKGMLDQASSAMKEIAFLTNSGGVDQSGIQKLGETVIKEVGGLLGDVAGKITSGAGTLVERITSFGQNIVKGDNVSMPDIYSGSSRTASITITIPLKCVYGNKYSYYFDYLVPLMHLLGLAMPRATGANSYTSPFLVKVFMKGVINCNLGIVTDISIAHDENMNADGLYMGGTVTLNITDLYPDMAMTPASHPVMFVNNSSLIEYLATQCGLNLLENKFSTKVSLFLDNFKNMPADIIDSEVGKVGQKIDDLLYSFTGL
jgi:hypothetical protein